MAIQTAQWAASRIQEPERVPADDGTPGTYHIWTIGCQMNKADSDRLASALEQAGRVLALNIVRGNGQLFIVVR